MTDSVNHPAHYGGVDNPYEVLKVAEAWGFHKNAYLFNVLKYIGRPSKGNYLEDLKKARFYLDREIANLELEDLKKAAEKLPPEEATTEKRLRVFKDSDDDEWRENPDGTFTGWYWDTVDQIWCAYKASGLHDIQLSEVEAPHGPLKEIK